MVKYSEYRDLTPIDNIQNGDEYLEALNWAFHNKKIKNIALTGPYGAGKSSIIETFLRKDEENKSILKRFAPNSIRSSALKISMATFLKGENANDGSDEKIKLDADEIEKGILKQLFYKVEPRKIPQSRYRKLHPISGVRAFIYVFITLIFGMFFTKIFAPDRYTYFVDAIKTFISPVSTAHIYTVFAMILMLMLIAWIIAYFYKIVISKFRVKEVKLPSDTTVKNGAEEPESVFNKNLDEIVYFFEATGYKTVFFEDLDRLEDPKIFVHLRELNNLLNNDDAIKSKPIVFVYAVRDDIFSKEDRTKFFDFIIPVIPVINSTNSGEILLQRLQEAKSKGIEHDISQGFVLDISPFISDMRILQNIYNEFWIYKKTLRTSQQLSLSDEQMFAMIVFKNLYPGDFADIQDEKGILKKAFINKNDFITKKKGAIQKEIDNYSSIIARAKNDTLNSVKELKYAMLGTLMNGFYKVEDFSMDKWNSSGVSVDTIMRDEYDLMQLIQNKYKYIFYENQAGYSAHELINTAVLVTFVERWKDIKEVEEKGLENLQDNLEDLRERQHILSSLSIVKLTKDYPIEEIFEDEVRSNKLLIFLLRRGYIDEKYANYINYFKGTSITKDDMNFILSVKNQSPLEFDYQLTKTSMVIERLQEYEFEQKAIYNFYLLEQLLGMAVSEKLMIFIQQLSNGEEVSWRFIDEFSNRTQNLNLFIRLLAENWPDLWMHISKDETLTYDRQIMYLQKILTECELSTIEEQNVDDCIRHYFETHADVLQKLASCRIEKMILVIDCLDIHFKSLETENVPCDVLDSVFNKCHYVLNAEMVKIVISYKQNALIDGFEKKPYSTLIMLEYTAIIQYVHDNIVTFVDEIVFAHRNLYDRLEDIVDMLIRLEGETDLQVELIERENFHLNFIKDCAYKHVCANTNEWMPVWNALLKKNVVDINWENIIDYWKIYQLSTELKDYISNHAETLARIDTTIVDDTFIKAFLAADFEQKIEQMLLPILRLEEFDLNIPSIAESTLKIMIDCNYFEFTVNRYATISSAFPDMSIDFILKNQDSYMSLEDNIAMSEKLFEQLILSDGFEEENKRQLFAEYAEGYITEEIAVQMKERNLPVSKEIFEAAWNCVDEKRVDLLLDYYMLLNADELERYFAELHVPYVNLSGRSRRHDVTLPITDKNRELADYLQKIGYITSWDEKSEKYFDQTADCEKIRKFLKLRIKQVK